MDTPTPGKQWKEVHWILLAQGTEIVIVEGLTGLEQLPASFTFSAFPLNIKGRDGSLPRRGHRGLSTHPSFIKEASMRGLNGKTAIVTGGATGIGRAIMDRLCSEGVAVTFTDISDDGRATQEECLAKHWSVQFVRGDMADEKFCRDAVGAAVDEMGRSGLPGQQRVLVYRQGYRCHARRLEPHDASRPDRLRHDGKTGGRNDAGPRGRAIVNISSISRISPSRIAGPTMRPREP